MTANIKGTTKTCPGCNQTKSTKEFYPSGRRDGFRTYCINCDADRREAAAPQMQTYNRAYYEENKEQLAAGMSKYYEENKAHLNEYSRGYYRRRRAQNREADILARTKSRAKKSGIPFQLSLEHIVIPEVCPVLGIPLNFDSVERKGPKMNSPSIDRIKPDLGYVPGNVRIISHRANSLKSNATVAELEMVLADLRTIAHGLRVLRAGA